MRIYVDTSFLVSLYTPDANSLAASRTMQASSGEHLVSSLAELELINAFELRLFRKELTGTQVRSARAAWESDLKARVFHSAALPDQVWDRARMLALKTTAQLGTRTADLLHVAAALELRTQILFSFDHQQRRLAESLTIKLN